MIKIKLCGLSRVEDIDAANSLQPDMVGFVQAENSRRYVSPFRVLQLKKRLAPGIKTVGVFVDCPIGKIRELAWARIFDVLQFHGHEDEAYFREVRREVSLPIIKAFVIKSREDLLPIQSCSADMLLLDSGAGTGKTFDWELLSKIKRPYFLAGGLDQKNVGEAVKALDPYGVDVSSGIETAGVKDPVKMEAFVRAARQAKSQ